ncbi:hypothetical protein ACRAVF_34010 (plasmid) [Bradyrhizobium oligotrophicum S58]
MLTDRLDEQTFHLMMMGFLALGALLGIAWALWDNAHPCAGDGPQSPWLEPDQPWPRIGDITTIPADQLHRLHRARFERMDGVL